MDKHSSQGYYFQFSFSLSKLKNISGKLLEFNPWIMWATKIATELLEARIP